MTTSEVLNQAADLIKRYGLGKGDYFDRGSGCHCTVGAVAHTISPEELFETFEDYDRLFEFNEALGFVGKVLGEPGPVVSEGYVTNWNDEPGRTQAEVVDTLRAAAKLAEAA